MFRKKTSQLDRGYQSAASLLVILAASVFIIEIAVMYLLHELPPIAEAASVMLDASLLTTGLFPIFYYFVFRPFVRKIEELKLAEERLALAAMVYSNSSEAMLVTDADGTIIAVNPAFTQLTGYTAQEAVGKTPKLVSSGRQTPAFYQAMWHALNTKGSWEGEIWNRRKNGEIYAEWLVVNSTFNEDGTIHRRVAQFSDITKKKESDDLIWKRANFDFLTGLPNRSMFSDRLRQAIKNAHRSGMPLAVMFLDLDKFKEINDTFGHDKGDVLLVEVARRLADCVRESDTVARLGGDEFTVLIPDLESNASADHIAQNIIEKFTAPFRLGNEAVTASTSIGIAIYPIDAADEESLLRSADEAMYIAKRLGGNHFSTIRDS